MPFKWVYYIWDLHTIIRVVFCYNGILFKFLIISINDSFVLYLKFNEDIGNYNNLINIKFFIWIPLLYLSLENNFWKIENKFLNHTLKYFPANNCTPIIAKISQNMRQTSKTLKIEGIAWTRAFTTTYVKIR